MTNDRFGERLDPEPLPHTVDDACGGWLGEDPEGRPIPCLVHRPHLRPAKRRFRAGLEDYPREESQ